MCDTARFESIEIREAGSSSPALFWILSWLHLVLSFTLLQSEYKTFTILVWLHFIPIVHLICSGINGYTIGGAMGNQA